MKEYKGIHKKKKNKPTKTPQLKKGVPTKSFVPVDFELILSPDTIKKSHNMVKDQGLLFPRA